MFLIRRFSWALLLVGSGCAQFQPAKVVDETQQNPSEDPAIVVEEALEPIQVAAGSIEQTIQDRFPYLRFIQHSDDDYSVILVAPIGFGAPMSARLSEFCDSTQGDAPAVTVKVVAGGGTVFSGNPESDPWASASSMKAVEDLVVIRGTVDGIEECLSFVDVFFNAGPQIEIQAQILEIVETDSFERGVQPNGTLIDQLGNVGEDGGGPFFRGLGGGFPATGIGDFASSGPGGVFSLAWSNENIQLDAFLQILRGLENVDIVSRPRIVTRNGIPAKIDSSEEIPFLKVNSVSTSTGITGLAVDTKKAGVTLSVQPFLMGGDSIHLVIKATASRIGRSFEVGTDSTGRAISVPSLNSRTASTSVVVRSGQSVVIGGMNLREDREQTSKIPILGDIPLIGWLFSSDEKVEAVTEVMIVITPEIKTGRATISKFMDEIFDPFEE
ncbi:MAG: type II and III secretion system protein [Planctomycetota bacterium]|nr:type II and III secretion system protein [Planctomycetota bacterium]